MTQIRTQTQMQTRPARQHPLLSTLKVSDLPWPCPPAPGCQNQPVLHTGLPQATLAVQGAATPRRKAPSSQGVPVMPPRAKTLSEMKGPAVRLSTGIPPTPRCPRGPSGLPSSNPPVCRHLPPGPWASLGQKHHRTHAQACTRTRGTPPSTGDRPLFSPAPPPLPKTDTPLEGRPEKIRREPLFTDSEKEV